MEANVTAERTHAGDSSSDDGPEVFDVAEADPAGIWAAVRGRRAIGGERLLPPDAGPSDKKATVLVPSDALTDYVVRRYTAGSAGAGTAEFNAQFNLFKHTAFRLETKQVYTVGGESARIAAWRSGLPLPERSVRTTPWLARIAFTTVTGKRWQRIHVVDHPLTDYLKYELIGYAESLAAGEEILIADRSASLDLAGLDEDFWLFDAGSQDAFGLLMHYGDDGSYLGFERTSRPADLERWAAQRHIALENAVSLSTYLVAGRAHGSA